MKKALQKASAVMDANEEEIRQHIHTGCSSVNFYGNSISKKDQAIIAMARDHQSRFLMVMSAREDGLIAKFSGEQIGDAGVFARKCPLDEHNAAVLREVFPWSAPISLRNRKTTIGCGDRLGVASPGHIAAALDYQVSPVLAQQSIRELTLTGRTYRDVVDDTTFLVFQSGFKEGYGADGDHLKTMEDINTALDVGMPMITLDLSEVMFADAGSWSDSEVEKAFKELPGDVRKRIEKDYSGKTFEVGAFSVEISPETARRCAVMYLKAMDFAAEVHEHLKSRRGEEFDLEISIDETTSPTLPEHHLFIAHELNYRKVKYSSLAPRFIGEFQKAVDYIGDPKEFARQFAVHAEIAKAAGNYKVSIHSGSDKFMVYPTIGEMTEMRLHLKTAGTSWLEAVRVIAEKDPVLYRVMHNCALENFSEILKLYHITADITKIPALDTLYDEDLPKLMDMPEARQLLHITYGPILQDHSIKPLFFSALHHYEEAYHEKLKAHFDKHLRLLGVPRR